MSASAADLRRWLENWRAVEDIEREEAESEHLSPEESLARALELIDFAASLHGWPLPVDEIDQREVEVARDRWAALRRSVRSR